MNTLRNFTTCALVLLCCDVSSVIADSCIVPSITWSNGTKQLRRCGVPGRLTNDTFYGRKETKEWIWKDHYDRGYLASFLEHSTFTYSGGISGSCSDSWTEWREANIPGVCSGNITNDPNGCISQFHNIFVGSDQITDPLCPSGFYSVYTNSLTDTNFERFIIIEHDFGIAQDCAGIKTNRYLETYSDPYTLPQFAADTLSQAKVNWAAGPSGPFAEMWLYPYTQDLNNDSMSALAVKVNFTLNTQAGVPYKGSWKFRRSPSCGSTNYIVIGGGSWEGMGTGGPLLISQPAPDPVLGDNYGTCIEVFDVNFRPEGDGLGSPGGGAAGCEGFACSSANRRQMSPGFGVNYLRSAAFMISLGAGNASEGAGALVMQEDVPSSSLAMPVSLKILTNPALTKVTIQGGAIHVAAPTMLARIVVSNTYSYWIHCSASNGPAYDTNAPFVSHLIVNPNGATDFNTLQHIRFTSSSTVTNEYVCETNTTTNVTWRLVSGNGLKGERLSKISLNPSNRLESYRIFNPTNQVELYHRERLYRVGAGTDLLLSEVIDPQGAALLTTNVYDSAGQLRSSTFPDGSWVRNEYHANGLLLRTVRPLMNQPPTASNNTCRVTEYAYEPNWATDTLAAHPGEPRTVTEFVQGQFVSKTMFAYVANDTYTQVSGSAAAGWNNTLNETNFMRRDAQGRVTDVYNADATRTKITYPSVSGGSLTTESGVWNGSNIQPGTKTVQLVDARGYPISTVISDVDASGTARTISQETYSEPDMFWNPTRITHLDGTSTKEVRQDCCQPTYAIDRDGVYTTNVVDALNRLVGTVRLGVSNSTVFDAADRPLIFKRAGKDGSTIVQRGLVYDAAGRVLRETNALQGVTFYSYSTDGAGQSVKISTYPDGGARTEVYFRDGQLAAVTNSAAFPVRYVYGADASGAFTTEIKLNTNGTDSGETSTMYSDFMGRSYKTVFAGGAYSQSFYNNKGQLWKERDPDGVTTLHGYNALGERAQTATDSNRNDAIEFGAAGSLGHDRITTTTNDVLSAHGTTVRRTRTYVVGTNNVGTSTLLTTFEISTDGLKTWRTTHNGAQSVVASTDTQIPNSPNAWTRTVTQTLPDSSTIVSAYQLGRLLSVTRKDSTGAQIGATTYSYDAHGRQSAVTDARNGSTTFTFNNADQVVSVTTPAPGNGAPAQTTTTLYDKMLRATATTAPDNGVVTNEFYLNGLRKRTSGARTYPVEYTYDYAGRLKTMKTWREFGNESTAAVTTWNYDAQRGWLANKRYADNYGPDYTYTAAARPLTRQWARSVSGNRVTTTYSYNDAGEMSGVSYNDGFTPAVTLVSDRRGQTVQTVRNGITTTATFTEGGMLSSENYSGGTLNGLSVTNIYDSLLRRTQVSAKNGATVLSSATYGYDNVSRLLTVTDGGANNAAYSYVENSPFVAQIVFNQNTTERMRTTKTYDRLNRLSTVNNQPSTDTPVSFSYDHNNANQRTRVTQTDGSYWRYEYDDLGQVTLGKKYWGDGTPVAGQQFEYAFDDIGNRTSTKAGGNENGSNLRSASYSVNSLNQYSSRTVPGAFDVFGVGRGTITVNSQSTYRKGEYFRKELAVANTGGPVQQPITVTATDGTITSQGGTNYLPKTPENLGYDLDGNLTNDGRWHLIWDAENRLVQMTTIAGVPTSAERRLQFEYDIKGRRVRKTAYNQAIGGTNILDNKFFYDGWNLIVELNGTNNAVVRSYTWGIDISGTMQGAGAVGGLLFVAINSASHFVGCDGNGNIETLVDASNGYSSAQYDYEPFGELVRVTGVAAKSNPLRFSTKFTDEESEWIYFGFRYLNPGNGSWLNRDPLAERGGDNLYLFVGNSSVNRTDLLGLQDFRGGWALPPSCSAVAHARLNPNPGLLMPNANKPSAGNQLYGYPANTDLTQWFEQEEGTTLSHSTSVNIDLLKKAIASSCLSGVDPTKLTGMVNPPQLITPRRSAFFPWGTNPLANELPPDDMGWWHATRTIGRYVIHFRNVRVDRTYVTCGSCGKCYLWQGDIEITDTPGVNPPESRIDAFMSGVGFQTQGQAVTVARWRHSGLFCCDENQ